ncbi:MAG TPA: GGDEF domain-containing protein [Acidimicrobiales bacterium]|jgi:diguanylate cyclase (GGDEF)-like protein|nr:GGDEF domain-containing protein [Acidimicrobiales bacterium]
MATTPKTTLSISSREDLNTALEESLHGGNAPVALALSDLDGFGDVNRERGHEAGDEVLALWEHTLLGNVPSDATVLRLGGDEYAAILPSLSVENALIVLDEIRGHFGLHVNEALGVTCSASIGVAANPPHGTTVDALFQAAGQALMRAKRDGGDRTAIYVEEKMVLKSNYYSRANLERLAKLSAATNRTEASLLRESLDDLIEKLRDKI